MVARGRFWTALVPGLVLLPIAAVVLFMSSDTLVRLERGAHGVNAVIERSAVFGLVPVEHIQVTGVTGAEDTSQGWNGGAALKTADGAVEMTRAWADRMAAGQASRALKAFMSEPDASLLTVYVPAKFNGVTLFGYLLPSFALLAIGHYLAAWPIGIVARLVSASGLFFWPAIVLLALSAPATLVLERTGSGIDGRVRHHTLGGHLLLHDIPLQRVREANTVNEKLNVHSAQGRRYIISDEFDAPARERAAAKINAFIEDTSARHFNLALRASDEPLHGGVYLLLGLGVLSIVWSPRTRTGRS